MKKTIVLSCLGVIGALCLAVAAKRAALPPAADPRGSVAHPMGKLVVHEWGTFTQFAGSDGVNLPFDTFIGSDLPGFVVNRQTDAMRRDRKVMSRLAFVKGGGQPALVRMETPVVYFYADAPGDVNVRVDFPNGTLTEFYPPVRDLGPKFGIGLGEQIYADPPIPAAPRPQTQPAESFLDWGRVRIVPHPAADEGKLIPAVTNGQRYAFARNTDSALVQYADADGTHHEEKFLFYRGLGNFALPVALVARGSDHFELRNAGAAPITSAFLVEVTGGDHKTTRFARFENIAGARQLTLPTATASGNELSEAIARSLIAEGLYEKEARAMVDTWKSTWLDDPGTRVLYFVRRPVTDAMLPLTITPAPQQIVRVMVGRIDVLTPEVESQIAGLMKAADTTTKISQADARMVTALGRFQTPALARIDKLAGDTDRRMIRKLYEAVANSQSAGK